MGSIVIGYLIADALTRFEYHCMYLQFLYLLIHLIILINVDHFGNVRFLSEGNAAYESDANREN